MKKTIALGALSAMALCGLAQAQDDSTISSEFAVSYNTDYVFRGFDLGENLYTYGLDFAGTDFCGFDWSAGIWYGQWDAGRTDVDIPGTGGDGVPPSTISLANGDEELDIYGEISKDFGAFSVNVGAIRYIFTDVDDSGNTEVYAGVGTEFAGFELGVTAYWNIDADEDSVTNTGDFYYELSAGYGHEFNDALSLSAGVTVGFFDFDGGDSGYAQVTATLGLTYALNDNMSLSPYVSYSDADDEYLGTDSGDDTFYGGVALAYSF